MNPTITHARGGWHHAQVVAPSAATGVARHYDVTWRTQRQYCHGQELDVADGTRVPVWVDRSYGEIAGWTTQCGTCGAVYTARYAARRIVDQEVTPA